MTTLSFKLSLTVASIAVVLDVGTALLHRNLMDTCRSKSSIIPRKGWFDNLFPAPMDDTPTNDRAQQYPEQYPATYELNLKTVEGDDADSTMVRPLLKNTQLESRPLSVVYDPNNLLQGWDARTFHQAVDGKGAAIIMAKAEGTGWFGGYNPKGWASMGGARPSVAAFLWYTVKNGQLQKLQKVGGGGLACAKDDPDTGIWIGADGLIIPLSPGKEKNAQSKLGTYFERGPEGLSSLFDGGAVQLTDLKVLVGIYEDGEEIPYSGAVMDFTSG